MLETILKKNKTAKVIYQKNGCLLMVTAIFIYILFF